MGMYARTDTSGCHLREARRCSIINDEQREAAGLPVRKIANREAATGNEFFKWANPLGEREGDEITTMTFAHPDRASYIARLFQQVAWQVDGALHNPGFAIYIIDEKFITAGQFHHDPIHTDEWAVPAYNISTDFINSFIARGDEVYRLVRRHQAIAQFNFGRVFRVPTIGDDLEIHWLGNAFPLNWFRLPKPAPMSSIPWNQKLCRASFKGMQ